MQYSDEKENERYSQLNIYGHVVIIRINPDENILSPPIWKKKVMIISPGEIKEDIIQNDEEFTKRIQIVKNVIVHKVLKIFDSGGIRPKTFFHQFV